MIFLVTLFYFSLIFIMGNSGLCRGQSLFSLESNYGNLLSPIHFTQDICVPLIHNAYPHLSSFLPGIRTWKMSTENEVMGYSSWQVITHKSSYTQKNSYHMQIFSLKSRSRWRRIKNRERGSGALEIIKTTAIIMSTFSGPLNHFFLSRVDIKSPCWRWMSSYTKLI